MREKCIKSKGEQAVEKYLNEHNIIFETQKRFKDCVDKKPLPFDFYLPDYNLCIEFDREQHYQPKFGMDGFLQTQKHDKIKNEYCNMHNIDLLRIPYWEGSNSESIIKNKKIRFLIYLIFLLILFYCVNMSPTLYILQLLPKKAFLF